MNYEDWLHGSGIVGVTIGRWFVGDPWEEPNVARVALKGCYDHPSYRVLRMAIAAALAWDGNPCVGLVVDVSEMKYFGGDTLLAWGGLIDADSAVNPDEFRTAFVCNEDNAVHVQSLIEDSGDEQRERVFRSEAEAVAFALGH